jgi:hypothetical protein
MILVKDPSEACEHDRGLDDWRSMSVMSNQPPPSMRSLVAFREELELGPELFFEITGLDPKAFSRYRRGKAEAPPVPPEGAIRIERCQKALRLAEELCGGNREAALDWLYADSPAFKGESPIDIAPTEAGLRSIETLIATIRAAAAAPQAPAPVAPKLAATVAKPAAPPPAAAAAPVQVQAAPLKTPLAAVSLPPAAAAPKPVEKSPEPIAAQASAPATSSSIPPPPGVDPDKRLFRIKERLVAARAGTPGLTLTKLSELMLAAGYTQFAVKTLASRIENQYSYATWNEVVGMAKITQRDPYWLAGIER